MAMSPTFAITTVFLPNLIKVKGMNTIIGVIERKEKFFFDTVWAQAHVTHAPHLTAQARDPFRFGVLDLPAPKEMGEAYFIALVIKDKDPSFTRYFTLEHDYVLATKANRTLVCERDGNRHTKHGEGPAITGDSEVDAGAFIDAILEVLAPTKAAAKTERQW